MLSADSTPTKIDREDLLAKLALYGIVNWDQVLLCLPKGYVTYSPASTLRNAMPREGVVTTCRVFSLVVSEAPVVVTLPKERIILTATDGVMTVKLVIIVVVGTDTKRWKELTVGSQIAIEGALQSWGGRLQIIGPNIVDPALAGQTIPQYEGIRGIVSSLAIYEATRHALHYYLDESATRLRNAFSSLSEMDTLRHAELVGSFKELFRAVHSPSSMEIAQHALRAIQRIAALSMIQNAQAMKLCREAPNSDMPIDEEYRLNVSILRDGPVKKFIQTRIVAASEVRRLYEHTRKVITAGGQVAVVCPSMQDNEQERKSVVKAFGQWDKEFPHLVTMIHGAMKEDERLEVITRFRSREFKVGVVSSNIELGITVSALKSLVVLSPERYGASTLHQLRGLVARTGRQGYFFMLLQDRVSEETMARLRLLEQINDGFELAERDANICG